MPSLADPSLPSYQFLIRFHNKTHVINVPKIVLFSSDEVNFIRNDEINRQSVENKVTGIVSTKLLSMLSSSLCIPKSLLAFSSGSLKTLQSFQTKELDSIQIRLTNPNVSDYAQTVVTFLTANLHPSFSTILGGKGGFGTLLKNQSKRAGAKTTLDFGACRDLNGRRLRHVNDEIKLRKWRENMNKKNSGRDASEDQQMVSGWHLNIPNWAAAEAGSEKVRKRNESKFQKERKREQEEREIKKRKKEEEAMRREQLALNYADQGNHYGDDDDDGFMANAIKEGLKKRMRVESKNDSKFEQQQQQHLEDDTNWLCSLAGDIITTHLPSHPTQNEASSNMTNTSKIPTIYVLGQSEFSTVCILRPNLNYYEIVLETCGLSQLGFADISSSANFAPNTDTGDGVGDDAFSFGYDVSRNKVFHNYKEFPYGASVKKATIESKSSSSGGTTRPEKGTVVGCWFNDQTGEISFFLNGEHLGIAFSLYDTQKESPKSQLTPAFSLNQGEVVGVRLGPYFEYNPCVEISSTPIQDDDAKETLKKSTISDNDNLKPSADSKPTSAIAAKDLNVTSTSQKPALSETSEIKKPASSVPEHLDLSSYESADALLPLGMDRLKSALLALGVKCG